jgi:hypothetical protein
MEGEGDTFYFYQKEENFVVLFEAVLGNHTVKRGLKGVV